MKTLRLIFGKKLSITFLSVLSFFPLFAQNNNAIVITHDGYGSGQRVEESGEIFINGISSKEDIGGVEVNIGRTIGTGASTLNFKNYNSFPVSVNYSVCANNSKGNIASMSGSIVLQAGESKSSGTSYWLAHDVQLIVRRLNLGNNESTTSGALTPERNKIQDKGHPVDGVLDKFGGYFYLYPTLIRCTPKQIESFVQNLNSKCVYGSNKWRVANAAEASLIDKVPSNGYPLGTAENLSNENITYNFVIVCE